MSYEVIARKWRPQQFDEVVGQDHVVRTLRNAISSNRIAHAYLFVGPRGIGKTTSARIFAKALNCEKGPTDTPCDACDSCREIIAGQGLDVIEIDGASNNNVDQVRDLRQNAQFAAARGRFKLYIIDEVHMLSNSAFNALLKILEEPPPHVKFMFATTEAHKIPATILSRCQRFDLRRIATADIVGRLREIAEDEELQIEEAALLAIARGAEGGLRDAESALDQLIAFQGKDLKEADVLSVFGLVSWSALKNLAGAIMEGDIPSLMRLVDEFDEQGKDMQRLLLELLEHFRDLLVLCHDPSGAALRDRTEGQREDLATQAGSADPGRLIQMMQILSEAEPRLRQSLSRRTLMETTLVRAARAATLVPIDRLVRELKALRESLGAGDLVSPPLAAPAPPPPAEAPARASAQPEPPPRPAAAKATAPPPEPAIDADADCATLVEKWEAILDKVGHLAPLARNSLRDAAPVKVDQTHVLLGFDPEFAGSLENLRSPKSKKAAQVAIGEVLGRTVTVDFTLLDGSEVLPGDHKLAPKKKVPESNVTEEPPELAPLPEMADRTLQDWIREPKVRLALEIFDGELDDVRT